MGAFSLQALPKAARWRLLGLGVLIAAFIALILAQQKLLNQETRADVLGSAIRGEALLDIKRVRAVDWAPDPQTIEIDPCNEYQVVTVLSRLPNGPIEIFLLGPRTTGARSRHMLMRGTINQPSDAQLTFHPNRRQYRVAHWYENKLFWTISNEERQALSGTDKNVVYLARATRGKSEYTSAQFPIAHFTPGCRLGSERSAPRPQTVPPPQPAPLLSPLRVPVLPPQPAAPPPQPAPVLPPPLPRF